VSKDSDCSLVSNKNLSEILLSNGLGPGSGEVGQGGLKVLHLWRHSRKIFTPQPKNYFSSANYKTSRIFWDFYRVCSAYRSGGIPAQSYVRSSCFCANRLN